jgi:tetratricopeptide (TPR) repeat protein
MKIINFCTKVIEYSFYAIFLLVPLAFAGNTSELFEFNKMWVAFGLTIFIGAAWFTKMIVEKKIVIQRTPLDIPILLFLLSQIISTVFSLDQHVSWWGYYSRFNGGLLSTITYVFLYYAYASNLEKTHVLKTLKVTLFSGIIVALWGLPSHFGYDPTCFIFRGTFDVSCWTDAFKPTVRIFSTLGQPAWLAAYLAILIPLTIAYALQKTQNNQQTGKSDNLKFRNSDNPIHRVFRVFWKKQIFFLLLASLFYIDLIFTNTRAGFIGFSVANLVFWLIIFVKKLFSTKVFIRYFLIFNISLLACSFFFGTPFGELNKFTLPEIRSHTLRVPDTAKLEIPKDKPKPSPEVQVSQANITDSGDIRKYVWQGAIDAWRSNALIGTGVETFAFAYYKFRPAGHNLTSEWDFLYNKAHNEYLNYLTTTGIFGLGTYLAFISYFVFIIIKNFQKTQQAGKSESLNFRQSDISDAPSSLSVLSIALFSGWISILISNFFGFSVVIINLFLFLIPLFVFILADMLPDKKLELTAKSSQLKANTNPYQWTIIAALLLVTCYLLINLSRYWDADTKYALGNNLDHVGSYQEGYLLLVDAVKIKPHEPVYIDELAINMAVLSTAYAKQKDTVNSSQFANTAIELSNQLVTKHPNNVVYLKNRVRLFYTLAQTNPDQQLTYYQEALKAIEKAHMLAPTDAKISYNLGVLYGQTGDLAKGITALEETIKMKQDYRDAYFALGLLLHQAALDQNGNVVNPELSQKAIETYKYILEKISPNDGEVQKALDEWGADKGGRY